MPRLAAGGALPDVVEVVGGEPHQLEGEVPLAHVRVGQDHRFLAEVQPGQRVQRVVVRAAAVPVGRIHHARGVPEMVDRGIGDHSRVPGLGHPVMAQLGVVDIREAVDERLHPGGIGVLGLPVQLCHVPIPSLMEAQVEIHPELLKAERGSIPVDADPLTRGAGLVEGEPCVRTHALNTKCSPLRPAETNHVPSGSVASKSTLFDVRLVPSSRSSLALPRPARFRRGLPRRPNDHVAGRLSSGPCRSRRPASLAPAVARGWFRPADEPEASRPEPIRAHPLAVIHFGGRRQLTDDSWVALDHQRPRPACGGGVVRWRSACQASGSRTGSQIKRRTGSQGPRHHTVAMCQVVPPW